MPTTCRTEEGELVIEQWRIEHGVKVFIEDGYEWCQIYTRSDANRMASLGFVRIMDTDVFVKTNGKEQQ